MPQVGKQSLMKNGDLLETKEIINAPVPPPFPQFNAPLGTHQRELQRLNRRNICKYLPRPSQRAASISRGWKPITLRTPIMCSLLVVSLGIIVILEVLSHKGASNGNGGGLVFAADVNSIPLGSVFGYLYLPTILSVCYSFMWSWVDLDVKRLEPWFQLSNTSGANARNSLLLQYPFDFLPFVPITALRRKHWAVFVAGSIMLMVFWIITPLQSAIFNFGTVTRSTTVQMGTSALMIPVDQQVNALNANFQNIAYGITWLNQSLPAFTTHEFAVFPFQPSQSDDVSKSSHIETWSTLANAFSTNLTCTPANVVLETTGTSYTFDNGKGCSVSQLALTDTQEQDFMIAYIGYFDNPEVDSALQNPGCPAEFSNTFLAIFAAAASRSQIGVYSNMTALFCETSYSSKQIHVSVKASTHSIVEFSDINNEYRNDNTTELGDVFNSTNFEYILATGVSSNGERANLQDVAVLQQYPRIESYKIAFPVSSMVGFALGLSQSSAGELADPIALQQAFQRAHQVLFISAFNVLGYPVADNELLGMRDGLRQDTLDAIIIVRPISIAVEVAFGIIILLSIALWYFSSRRPSNLCADPGSISDIMSLMPSSSFAQEKFRDDGMLTADTLETRLSDSVFYLDSEQNDELTIRIQKIPSGDPNLEAIRSVPVEVQQPVFSIRPLGMQLYLGSLFILLLFGSIVGLAYLQITVLRNNGIILPTTNSVVLSIIENYLPTSLPAVLEPAWVILNRLLCVLQPFDTLRKGKAAASASIEAKYTSLPPQLVIFRALRSRHFLLAAVCVIAISTNVLSVVLSAILYERPIPTTTPMMTSQSILPQFIGGFSATTTQYFDHFYVAMSNLSFGTPLPTWIDEKFFYLPFDLHPPLSMHKSQSGNMMFQGSTIGFGAESTCVELLPDQELNGVHFYPNANGSSAQFTTSYLVSNGTSIRCYPQMLSSVANQTTEDTGSLSSSPSALEIVHAMTQASDTEDTEFCNSKLVFGWVRDSSNSTDSPQDHTIPLEKSLDFTFLSCTYSMRVASFDVLVDVEGHVLEANKTSSFSEDLGIYFTGNTNETYFFQQTIGLLSSTVIAAFTDNAAIQDFTWHNDSFTSDWMNVIFTIAQGSNKLVDPSLPVPKFENIAPLVQNTMEQLFAILLRLRLEVFEVPKLPTPGLGASIVSSSRLFVSYSMFLVAIAILSLHTAVAIWYYACRPKRFLPRMPTSIGSIMAYVSGSRAVEDFYHMRREINKEKKELYGYGSFLGTDGKTHVGIERQRYVIPLESQNLEVRRRRWGWPQERNSREPRIWI